MKKIFLYTGYWILQCTWGILMTSIGAVAALIMLITGHKPHTLGPNIYFITGNLWGGVSFGPFFFCCEEAEKIDKRTLYHESGHSLQNILWGPLFPFVIGIPSLLRYWVFVMRTYLKQSLFNLFFLFTTLILTTLLACITGPLLHLHWLTIGIEVLRIYFLLTSLWLTLFEIPKHRKDYVNYDDIWFEGQATCWGAKLYKEKED